MPVTTLPARGRPTLYSEEIAAEICERLAAGESLIGICRDAHLPNEPTVRRWAIEDREGFSARYAQARALQAHAVAEKGYADALTAEDAQKGRLAFDAAKWFAAKLAPKVYGDRMQLDVTERSAAELGDDELARIATGSGARAS